MISSKPVAVFILFLLALPSLAQEGPVKEIGALIKQLELENRRKTAIAELARLGLPAAEALLAALGDELKSGREGTTGAMVRALGALGGQAMVAQPKLEELAAGENQYLARLAGKALRSMHATGLTIVADYSGNAILVVDAQGDVVHRIDEVFGAWDAEILPNGNYLITEFVVSRISERTRRGDVVWSMGGLTNPYDADRLPNGNTLIADTFGNRVIEVDKKGQIVWSYSEGIRPFDVERLENGNTLIADARQGCVLEVDPEGEIVWKVGNMPYVHDADRLPNGNTLIVLRTLHQVLEVDPNGHEVFRIDHLNFPSDADRLPNGNTLVAEKGMVREFDPQGRMVWKRAVTWAVEANRY